MTLSATTEHVADLTADWGGERDALGRPVVPDGVLERMRRLTVEHVWHVLDARGYPYQYTGGWCATKADVPLVGRAFTSQYLPHRPDLERFTRAEGRRAGLLASAQPNAWVVDMLDDGDVMVADIFGKIVEGTVIGDNLGTAIATRTKAGAVIDGGVRDLAGLRQLDQANFYFRDSHPTPIKGVALAAINTAVSIGGVTVLPGDVVFAVDGGVTFIPAHLAEEVVETAEEIIARDAFSKQRIREGRYTAAELDLPEWEASIEADYRVWSGERGPR